MFSPQSTLRNQKGNHRLRTTWANDKNMDISNRLNLIEFVLHDRRVLADHVELDVGLVCQRVPVLEALGHQFLECAADDGGVSDACEKWGARKS